MMGAHVAEQRANSAMLNDNDMATGLRHRLMAEGKKEEVGGWEREG